MCARNLCEYATIRVIPDIERGEYILAGLILLCRTQRFLKAYIALETQRLHMLDPDIDIQAIEQQLAYFPRVCHGGQESGPIGQLPIQERFRWLTAPRNTVIQPSPVHSCICDEPQQMFERLIKKYVPYSL